MVRHQSLIPISREHRDGLMLAWRLRIGDLSRRDVELRVKHAIAFYDTRLVRHFEAEEQALFPAVRAALGAEAALLDRLVREHRELSDKANSLRAGQQGELRGFCDLLESHIRTEERQLFELIQGKMEPAELEAVGREIKRRLGLA